MRKLKFVTMMRLLSAVMIMFTAGCSRAAFTAVNLPTYFDDIKVVKDISYGKQSWQKLDIYRPSDMSHDPLGVIVFFYGGRWTFGSKDDYRFVGSAFAKQGYVVVIPDYSKYPEVKFPVFVEDAAASIAWVSDHIADYGGIGHAIYIMGHSAGAHIGALVTADAHYLQALGKNRHDLIAGFIGMAGPYAFTPDTPDLEDMFGPPANYPHMQVPTYIDGRQPPMLLLYGDADKDVGRSNLDRLVARIHEKGGCVQDIIYPGVDHIGLVGAISWLGDKAPVVQNSVDFMRQNPKCKSR